MWQGLLGHLAGKAGPQPGQKDTQSRGLGVLSGELATGGTPEGAALALGTAQVGVSSSCLPGVAFYSFDTAV